MSTSVWPVGNMRPFCLATIFLLVFSATSHAEILQSQVLNAHTGQPIGGAAVLGLWWNKNGLVVEAEIETDAQGHFRLNRPAGPIPQTQESVAVYKCGYVV